MDDRFVLNVERALDEKNQQQKIFIRENGYRSSVLDIVIEHLEGMKHE